MARDTRIFRVTGERPYHRAGGVRIVTRTALSGIVSYAKGHKYGSWQYGKPVKIEATNEEATAGWTDVTEEFLGS